MKEKHLQYHSSKIFYRITGKGKPVVLIHGFGEDGNIWDKQVDFLQDQFQLIVPDLPGSGKSGVISSQSAVGMEEYAEIIKAILVEEKIEKSTMLGHSLGGYITLAFAEKYPGMLNSFGLVHSTAFADSEEKKTARLKSIEFIKKYGPYDFLRNTIPGLFNPSGRWKRPDGSRGTESYIEELVEKGKNFSSEALIQYYQAMINRPDRTAVLKNFSKPILFIIGEQDNAVPFAQSMQQCYLPVQSHIHILRNSAHMGMLEETAATNNFLLGFLQ